MASAFAFVYNKEFLKGWKDHTLQPLTEQETYPNSRLHPHYVRPNIRVHTGDLSKLASGTIHNEHHLRAIQHHGSMMGKHMGDRMFGNHF